MSKNNPIIVTVKKVGTDYIVSNLQTNEPVAFTTDKNSHSGNIYIPAWRLNKAVEGNFALKEAYTARGVEWQTYEVIEGATLPKASLLIPNVPVFSAASSGSFLPSDTHEISVTAPVVENTHEAIKGFIHSSYALKPQYLKMSELKWKYMVRSAMRGRNIMLVGESGSGKTLAATTLPKVLGRPYEIFNLGATQDPRSFLIGNTHLDKATGTFFDESLFVRMIQTPNAIIVLDEFTRALEDAHNILMPVLDVNQRYLRIEEAVGTRTIRVAEGVTFVSTANIGNEYTATKVLDKAMFERHTVIEMDLLTEAEEIELLTYLYPALNRDVIKAIASIVNTSRVEKMSDTPKISHGISTRTSVDVAGLMFDGFKLAEAAEAQIYPFYEAEGGNNSERTFIKQVVQKEVDVIDQDVTTSATVPDALFTPEELAKAPK